jgi:hypothetical protein
MLSGLNAPTSRAWSSNISTHLGHRLPRLVLAADRQPEQTSDGAAECVDSDEYHVYPTRARLGEPASLIERLRGQVSENESLLIGFDFLIGLPAS